MNVIMVGVVNGVMRVRQHFTSGIASFLLVKYIWTNVFSFEESGGSGEAGKSLHELSELGVVAVLQEIVEVVFTILQSLMVFFPFSFSDDGWNLNDLSSLFAALILLGGIMSPQHFWDSSGPVRKDLSSFFAKVSAVFASVGLLVGLTMPLFGLVLGLLCLVWPLGMLVDPTGIVTEFGQYTWGLCWLLGHLAFYFIVMMTVARMFFIAVIWCQPDHPNADTDFTYFSLSEYVGQACLPLFDFVLSSIVLLIEMSVFILLIYVGFYLFGDHEQAASAASVVYHFFLAQLQ